MTCQIRQLALDLGLKRYSTGKPCKNGHVSERFADGHCVVCVKNGERRWRRKNRDRLRVKERERERRSRLRAALLRPPKPAPMGKWLRRKLDKTRQKLQTEKAHPRWANRKAIAQIYEAARILDVHVDHVVPLRSPFVCGLHAETNLRLALPMENIRKGNRYWPDMWGSA